MEKLLPQSIDAECGVIGSLLIDPDAITQIGSLLRPRDFYRDAHRKIYEAMLRLMDEGKPTDYLTLCDDLERHEALRDIGGSSYLSSLLNAVPTSGNVEHYAEIVAQSSQLRESIHAASQVVADAYAPGASADEVLAKAQQRFFEISQRAGRKDFVSSADLMSNRVRRLEYLHQHRGAILGIPTGFGVLDQMTGGLQRSDLIILAARPGVGKTSLALSLAANAALRYGQRVAMYSLEMSKEQLGDRLLSMIARVDQSRLRTGWIEDDEWEQIVDASDKLAEASIWIDDTAGITPRDMSNRARRLQSEHGVDLIIVDYLQLMQSDGKKHENRVQEVSEISRSLKGLARELNVPVLALSQLSRAVESRQNKVPLLSDLRESGSIEQDADIVMFIYRDELYNPESERRNIADVIVAKHRNGPVGEISLHFDPTQTRFDDMEV